MTIVQSACDQVPGFEAFYQNFYAGCQLTTGQKVPVKIMDVH